MCDGMDYSWKNTYVSTYLIISRENGSMLKVYTQIKTTQGLFKHMPG